MRSTQPTTAAYRAPMRARDRDIGPYDGALFGLGQSVVGIGGKLDPAPDGLPEAVLRAATELDGKTSRMISNFAAVPDGSFVWTQVADEEYRLGRLAGPWRYEETPESSEAGIFHLRPVEWLPRSLSASATPPSVLDTFARGGRNFQRIRDREAVPSSKDLWGASCGIVELPRPE